MVPTRGSEKPRFIVDSVAVKHPVLHSNGPRLGTRGPAILTILVVLFVSMIASASADASRTSNKQSVSITKHTKKSKKSKKAKQRAKARKKNKRLRTSAVTVNVSNYTPANGATISGKVRWEVRASSSDGIARVNFYVNNTKYWTDSAAPYIYNSDGNIDTTVAPNGTYTLRAEAVTKTGVAKSSSISVRVANGSTPPPPPPPPPAPAKPATPTGLYLISRAETSTTFGWNASSGATSYEASVDGVVKAAVTGTTATVPTTCGRTSTFSVVAVNSGGKSAPGSGTTTTANCSTTPPPPAPTAPATPTGLKVTGGTATSTSLGWNASSNATSYEVSVDGAVKAGVTGTSASVTTACGKSTTFSVVAANSAGKSAAVSITAMTTSCPVTPPPNPGGFTATPVDHAHVNLSWPATSGASTYAILRDGKQLATRASNITTYQDSQLWFSTSYSYTVRALNSSGGTIATLGPVGATTKSLPASGFPVDFKSGGLFTTPLGAAPPIHPRNSQFISYVNSHLSNPNMPMRAYGIPFYEAEKNDPKHGPFKCIYACNVNSFVPVPIPQDADVDPGTDRHMTVYSRDNGMAYDYYKPVQDATGKWVSTSAGAVIPFNGNGIVPKNLAGSNAANIAAMAGIVYPEELAQGRIDHALMIGIPGIAGGAPACPSTHNVGTTSDANALPEGARLQLDPTINVDSLAIPAWQKTIARAMQTYGGYVRDNSGTFAVYAETSSSVLGGRGYDGWSKTGLGLSTGSSQSFSSAFPWNRMRVINFKYGPDC
jgi:hypothetical protein